MKSLLKAVWVVWLCLIFTGCEAVDSQIQERLRQYFPLAEISHPRPDVFFIDTHAQNASEKFWAQAVATMLRQYCCHAQGIKGLMNQDLDAVLALSGYTYLGIVFNDVACGWVVKHDSYRFACGYKSVSQDQWHIYSIYDEAPPISIGSLAPSQLTPVEPNQSVEDVSSSLSDALQKHKNRSKQKRVKKQPQEEPQD